jgi:hypothetical protein
MLTKLLDLSLVEMAFTVILLSHGILLVTPLVSAVIEVKQIKQLVFQLLYYINELSVI